ncbi:uncharacterized protein IUM83_19210 [Phytophthora cinnamomi]|uniref:uncharacterized protein n=1 Tax=Phytophthora cinnamomi TaxID=4785 RepID=UPI00355ACAC8|nr:hypothetical protein IUM83_19210 [Phytophthora cinnamomi]
MPATSTATSRSGLRRRAQSAPHPGQFDANPDKTQGTCSYYPPDEGGCRAPRTCYDCLNADLDREPEGCMINTVGKCVSVTDNYDASLDFRVVSAAAPVGGDISNSSSGSSANDSEVTLPPSRALTTQVFEMEFPAVNTTYCEANDVLFNEEVLADAGFMYGTGGCVFVEVCQVPSWAYVVGGSDCSGATAAEFNGPSRARDDKHGNPQGDLVFWCVAIAILLTLVATLAMVITIHHHHNKRRLEELQRRRTIVVSEPVASSSRCMTPKSSKSGVRLLNLFGWEAMRADLIEKERQERLGGLMGQACEGSLSGVSPSTNYLQLVGAQPSAPVMSPIASSAPQFTELA